MNTPFITIEGPIGVGKSSLTNAIGQAFSFHVLHEIVEENPFLSRFYGEMDLWAMQTELFFLANRYQQLRNVDKHHLSHGNPVVSDYHIFKNLIFSKQTLSGEELHKYLRIYDILTENMPQASLIIYLRASVETLLSRIQKRGRPFEQEMDPGYLRSLVANYDAWFTNFTTSTPDVPVLYVDGDQLDFVNRTGDLQYVLEQVKPYAQS